MFAFLAVCALITVVADQETADIAGVIGVFAGFGISGWLFVTNARSLRGRERLGWMMVGIGVLFAAAGVFSIALTYLVVGDAPAFGWSDLFFFGTYGFLIAGLATLPHMQGSPLERWRMALDGLIGAVSIGALLWVFVISDLMLDLQGLSPLARTIGTIYPFLDLVIITVAMLVLLRRSAYRFDLRMILITVAVVAQVLGDILYLVSAREGSWALASPPYVINIAGIAAAFAAAYLVGNPSPAREYADRQPLLWTVVAPFLPAVGMVSVFVVTTFGAQAGNVDLVLLGATILVGLLVIARQGVAIVENRMYIERQRNTLVSTISHELRTPLTAIVGFVELLEEEDQSIGRSERMGMLDIVHRQADYMSRIVSDLIMLARDSGDNIELMVEPALMVDIAEASIEAAGMSRQSVSIECTSGLTGFVDSARIQQVLVNLLTNAMRYGGPQRLLRVTAKDSNLVLEVHDDGPGVPRRHEVRVWERFERGPNRLNAAVPGSGIGLAIVDVIAKSHGGSADYRISEELGGACFSVNLPGRVSYAEDSSMTHRPHRAVPL
jgi:signal transduction histidine kinase